MQFIKLSVVLIFLLSTAGLKAQQPNIKRGISFGSGDPKTADVEAISGKLWWVYNWGPAPLVSIDTVYQSNQVEFVPMAWNGNFSETALRQYYSTHPEAKFLLGFNEPNFKDQANMKPSEAAAKWPLLEVIAADYGLELVGPAVNYCGNCVSENGTTYTNPFDYLDDFFAACPDCKVDYIAVHNYMCYSGPLVDYLEGFKKYGKKIWLTEFACWDQPTITLDMQKNLMIGALDYLDNDTMIYRYAWFIGRAGNDTPHITLFENEPGKLSELGELYVNYQATHDTAQYIGVPARIEAESYSAMQGITLELTADFDGIANAGYIDAGDWLQYQVDAVDPGDYFLYLRLAAARNCEIEIWVDDTLQSTLQVASTNGYQSWKTFKTLLSLGNGKSKVRLVTPTGGFNINWLRISEQDNHSPQVSLGNDMEIVLPQNKVQIVTDVTDADGDNLIYQWKKTSGPTCQLDNYQVPDLQVTNMVKGTYTFRLTVFDGFETSYDDIKIKVNQNVGITNRAEHLAIFPVPAAKQVTISGSGFEGTCTIEIYEPGGKRIVQQPVLPVPEITLNIYPLQPGVYVLKLKNQHGETKTGKLVVSE